MYQTYFFIRIQIKEEQEIEEFLRDNDINSNSEMKVEKTIENILRENQRREEEKNIEDFLRNNDMQMIGRGSVSGGTSTTISDSQYSSLGTPGTFASSSIEFTASPQTSVPLLRRSSLPQLDIDFNVQGVLTSTVHEMPNLADAQGLCTCTNAWCSKRHVDVSPQPQPYTSPMFQPPVIQTGGLSPGAMQPIGGYSGMRSVSCSALPFMENGRLNRSPVCCIGYVVRVCVVCVCLFIDMCSLEVLRTRFVIIVVNMPSASKYLDVLLHIFIYFYHACTWSLNFPNI